MKGITKEQLVTQLKKLYGGEEDHAEADGLLVRYINDPEVTKAYEAIKKWYA